MPCFVKSAAMMFVKSAAMKVAEDSLIAMGATARWNCECRGIKCGIFYARVYISDEDEEDEDYYDDE